MHSQIPIPYLPIAYPSLLEGVSGHSVCLIIIGQGESLCGLQDVLLPSCADWAPPSQLLV